MPSTCAEAQYQAGRVKTTTSVLAEGPPALLHNPEAGLKKAASTHTHISCAYSAGTRPMARLVSTDSSSDDKTCGGKHKLITN